MKEVTVISPTPFLVHRFIPVDRGNFSGHKSVNCTNLPLAAIDLEERRSPKVEIGKRYHWKLTRQDNTLSWYIDDMETPFLRFEDKTPLAGTGQDYFAFNNWESDSWFDNLRISKL